MLIDQSAMLGMRLKIRPSVIGMTVIAFGTSLPEFVVSFRAVLYDSIEIAFGNVIGSNIANIALVLGISAVLVPVVVERSALKREVPYLIVASSVFYLLCINNFLYLIEGIIMLFIFTGFIVLNIKTKGSDHISSEDEEKELDQARQASLFKMILFIILGFAGVIYGSKLALDNAILIAEALGISQIVIGLTVIAIGTSLPELATSIAAIMKNKHDIAIGNIVGSCLFNIFFILGFSLLFKPMHIPSRSLTFEIPIMVLLTVFLMVIPLRTLKINRLAGIFLIIIFIGYLLILFL